MFWVFSSHFFFRFPKSKIFFIIILDGLLLDVGAFLPSLYPAQQTHNVVTTSLQRRCSDVLTTLMRRWRFDGCILKILMPGKLHS